MAEVSEKERKRRKEMKDADAQIPAQSFRLGQEARDKLLSISRRRDKSQANCMRDMIDFEYERMTNRRKLVAISKALSKPQGDCLREMIDATYARLDDEGMLHE